jgi:hypothetical protein
MPKSVTMIILLSIVGLIIGVIISDPIVDRMYDGAFTKWKSLGAPAEPITGLVGWEQGERNTTLIRVMTASGKEYDCCSEGLVWRESTPSELVHNEACLDLPPLAPTPPFAVDACVEIAAYEYATDRTQFALLDDGTVWTWHQRVSLGTVLQIICAGALLGALLGGLWSWYYAINNPLIPIEELKGDPSK